MAVQMCPRAITAVIHCTKHSLLPRIMYVKFWSLPPVGRSVFSAGKPLIPFTNAVRAAVGTSNATGPTQAMTPACYRSSRGVAGAFTTTFIAADDKVRLGESRERRGPEAALGDPMKERRGVKWRACPPDP